jgi:ferritin heavy chain
LQVAEEFDDVQMCDYLEGTFLEDQVQAINHVSKYVSELRRVGEGHGEFSDLD